MIIQWVPKSMVFRYEYAFRFLHSLFYLGNEFQCNICGSRIKSFIASEKDRICPRCGSIQRTRRLWNILNSEFLKKNLSILDFSPSRSIYRKLKKGNYAYVSSDLSGNFLSDVAYDITHIPTRENSFDLIICYHVLEHIENDLQAMEEIYRVLKKGGFCLVQTPFKQGEIYEDSSIISPEEREKHFGQSDHVRIYARAGLQKRLESAGLEVEPRIYREEKRNWHGFSEKETVLIGQKR